MNYEEREFIYRLTKVIQGNDNNLKMSAKGCNKQMLTESRISPIVVLAIN